MATTSIKAVRALGLDGMATLCELLINVVKNNEPKMLRGSSQKALWPGKGAAISPFADLKATGGKAEPTPSGRVDGTW
jgi:hypothetical protein